MDLARKLKETIEQYEDDDKMKSFLIDEELIGEDYPEAFNFDELNAQKSYAAKKRYITQHLKKIGSGSARDVYAVDNTKVVKLAKNDKGIAQNSVESQQFIQNHFTDVVAQVFESDDNDYWHEMELARKISPKRFKELTGLSFDAYGNMMRYILDNVSWFGKPSQEMVDAYYEHPFAGQVIQMAQDLSMPGGDFQRISTYGEVLRDGKPAAVVVDYGLDENVFSSHYKRPAPKYY